jgi:hypothetical protein
MMRRALKARRIVTTGAPGTRASQASLPDSPSHEQPRLLMTCGLC